MTEQKLKPAAAGQVERPVRPPVRALRLTLQIGADSRRDMVGALLNFARRIDREELSGSGTWGGAPARRKKSS